MFQGSNALFPGANIPNWKTFHLAWLHSPLQLYNCIGSRGGTSCDHQIGTITQSLLCLDLLCLGLLYLVQYLVLPLPCPRLPLPWEEGRKARVCRSCHQVMRRHSCHAYFTIVILSIITSILSIITTILNINILSIITIVLSTITIIISVTLQVLTSSGPAASVPELLVRPKGLLEVDYITITVLLLLSLSYCYCLLYCWTML